MSGTAAPQDAASSLVEVAADSPAFGIDAGAADAFAADACETEARVADVCLADAPETGSRAADACAADAGAADACVLALYRELLHRDPGPDEHAAWRNVLLDGLTQAGMRDAVMASDEYKAVAAMAERRAAVTATGLFDAAWYVATYPDVAAAGVDPLTHYYRFGWQEQRAPNAYFEDAFYRARAGIPPDTLALLDYAARGEAIGLAPGPHFDPVWYRAAYKLDDGTAPLAHFLAHRLRGHVAPSPRLWGLGLRHDAAASQGDPFAPFLTDHDDPARQAEPDLSLLTASGLFDRNHYQIINTDVADAGMDMLVHYCRFGWKEGRRPNFYFDHAFYRATNPDVVTLGVNPLLHYLLVGEPANRRPSVYFEPDWYRNRYGVPPDTSPLAHYLAHRHTQRFSPNSLFDPAWYRAQCGEPLRERRDLFAHYLIHGMQNDTRPSPEFDAAAWRRRTTGRPSRHFTHTLVPERNNPLVTFMLAHYR